MIHYSLFKTVEEKDLCDDKKCGDVCDTSHGMLMVIRYCQPDGSCGSDAAPQCEKGDFCCIYFNIKICKICCLFDILMYSLLQLLNDRLFGSGWALLLLAKEGSLHGWICSIHEGELCKDLFLLQLPQTSRTSSFGVGSRNISVCLYQMISNSKRNL